MAVPPQPQREMIIV